MSDEVAAKHLSARSLFWSIFWALWAFSLSAGLAVVVIRFILFDIFWLDIPK